MMRGRASDDETRVEGGLLGSEFCARLSTSCHTGAVVQTRQLESQNQLDLTQQMGPNQTMTVKGPLVSLFWQRASCDEKRGPG